MIQDGLRERWGSGFDPDANPDTDDLWASYVSFGDEVVVAVIDGRVVGTGILTVSGRVGQLVRVSTHPEYRRRGVARRVVDELVSRARLQGLDRLVVATDTPWRSAVALYVLCGFEIVEQSDLATRFELALEPSTQKVDYTNRA